MRRAKKQQQHRGYCPSMVQPSNSFPPGQRPKYFLSRSASPLAFPFPFPFPSLPFPSLPFLSQASIPIPYSALPPPPPSPLPAPKFLASTTATARTRHCAPVRACPSSHYINPHPHGPQVGASPCTSPLSSSRPRGFRGEHKQGRLTPSGKQRDE